MKNLDLKAALLLLNFREQPADPSTWVMESDTWLVIYAPFEGCYLFHKRLDSWAKIVGMKRAIDYMENYHKTKEVEVRVTLALLGFKEKPANARKWWFTKGDIDVYCYGDTDKTECAICTLTLGFVPLFLNEIIPFLYKEKLV